MQLLAYLPVAVFIVLVTAVLFATAADRGAQWERLITVRANFLRRGALHARLKNFHLRRVIFWLLVLYLLSYIIAYQRAQDAIAAELSARGVSEVAVGSLIIPHSAFFRSDYTADAGFSKSKKRVRGEITLRGSLLNLRADIPELSFAKINTLTGEKFVFSYLTDVKVLRPAIHRHMDLLLRGKQIDKYEIETFDNRGPYIVIALTATDTRDPNIVAAEFAAGLHLQLTKNEQLKVNQVVVKVAERDAWLAGGGISVIGRGTAGNY